MGNRKISKILKFMLTFCMPVAINFDLIVTSLSGLFSSSTAKYNLVILIRKKQEMCIKSLMDKWKLEKH